MASRFGQRRAKRHQELSASSLLRDPRPNPLNELSHSTSWWADKDEHKEQGDAVREQLREMDEHVARLQDMLRCERSKSSHLQLRCQQLEAELRRREQLGVRLKERLSQQLCVRSKDKGPSIEVLNRPAGGHSRREQPVKSSTAKREEGAAATAVRLMLERREAELREAMKLRHSLTTLLHALTVHMEQALSDSADDQDEVHDVTLLCEAEVALGDHVTGGVVQSWRKVQRRMGLFEGHTGAGTDQDKLFAQLQTELRESQQLVIFQQQMLQESLVSPVPPELADSYFLEEWERLQLRGAELEQQRRTFEKERQVFTDAAIRLSRERHDFEQQKASLVKQQYLCNSPLCGKGSLYGKGDALSYVPGLGATSISGCLPITPSSDSGSAPVSAAHQESTVGVPSPSRAELYAALDLSGFPSVSPRIPFSSREVEDRSHAWDHVTDQPDMAQASHLDWSFE